MEPGSKKDKKNPALKKYMFFIRSLDAIKMPQIHSAYSSQLNLTVAALPTINIARGCASGRKGPHNYDPHI